MITKKIMRYIAVISFVLSIVLFFALNIQFDRDPSFFSILENKDVISTLHRLSAYYIPALCLTGGMFALVFTTKKVLIFMAALQLVTCYLLSMYIGKSVFMLMMLVIYTTMSVLYFVSALFYKSEIKKSR